MDPSSQDLTLHRPGRVIDQVNLQQLMLYQQHLRRQVIALEERERQADMGLFLHGIQQQPQLSQGPAASGSVIPPMALGGTSTQYTTSPPNDRYSSARIVEVGSAYPSSVLFDTSTVHSMTRGPNIPPNNFTDRASLQPLSGPSPANQLPTTSTDVTTDIPLNVQRLSYPQRNGIDAAPQSSSEFLRVPASSTRAYPSIRDNHAVNSKPMPSLIRKDLTAEDTALQAVLPSTRNLQPVAPPTQSVALNYPSELSGSTENNLPVGAGGAPTPRVSVQPMDNEPTQELLMLEQLLADHERWSEDVSTRIINSALTTATEVRAHSAATTSKNTVSPEKPQPIAGPSSLSRTQGTYRLLSHQGQSSTPRLGTQADVVTLSTPLGRQGPKMTPASADRRALAENVLRALRPPKRKREVAENHEQEGTPLQKKLKSAIPVYDLPETSVASYSGRGLQTSSSTPNASSSTSALRFINQFPMQVKPNGPAPLHFSTDQERQMADQTLPSFIQPLHDHGQPVVAAVTRQEEPTIASKDPAKREPLFLPSSSSPSPVSSHQAISSHQAKSPHGVSNTNSDSKRPSFGSKLQTDILSNQSFLKAENNISFGEPSGILAFAGVTSQANNTNLSSARPETTVPNSSQRNPRLITQKTSQKGIKPSMAMVYVLIPPLSSHKTKRRSKGEEEKARRERKHVDDEGDAMVEDFARRLIRRPCLWKDCHAILDSEEKLIKHIKFVHIMNQKHDQIYKCKWVECPSDTDYLNSEKLLRHLRWHATTRIHCAYKSCNFQTQLSSQLLQHVSEFHQDGDGIQPFALPTDFEQPPTLPIFDTLPSYFSVPLPVCASPITFERHQKIGPGILRTIISSFKRKAVSRLRPILVSQIEDLDLDVDDDCKFTWDEKLTKSFGTLTQLPPYIDEVDILEGDLLGQPIIIDSSNSRQTGPNQDPTYSLEFERPPSSGHAEETVQSYIDILTDETGRQTHGIPIRDEAESREVESLL